MRNPISERKQEKLRKYGIIQFTKIYSYHLAYRRSVSIEYFSIKVYVFMRVLSMY